MKPDRILKFTRSYKGLFNEQLSRWLYKSFFAKKIYQGITWFQDEPIMIHFSSNDYIERRVWMMGEYESEIAAVFAAHVQRGNTVLDVGANIGINTIRLSKLVGETGKVYAFEPVPDTAGRFRSNMSLNSCINVSLFECALSEENTTISMNNSKEEENKGAFNLRSPDGEGVAVAVYNGDHLLSQQHIGRVDLIKIDVEGLEWSVVKGLEQTIAMYKPVIVVEWDPAYQQQMNVNVGQWSAFVSSNNYTVYQISRFQLSMLEDIRDAVEGNLLLINKHE